MVLAETTLGRPELLGGPIHGNGICIALAALKEGGLKEVSVDFWAKGGDYLRLVAKIAHGFAVAALGTDSFSPFLAPIILEDDHPPEDLWKYIGAQQGILRGELHRVRIDQTLVGLRSSDGLGTSLAVAVVAYIQLFGIYSAPIYEVVVGVMRPQPKGPVEQQGSNG